jgi:hypothetical protein
LDLLYNLCAEGRLELGDEGCSFGFQLLRLDPLGSQNLDLCDKVSLIADIDA